MLDMDPRVPATVIIEHLRRDGYECARSANPGIGVEAATARSTCALISDGFDVFGAGY